MRHYTINHVPGKHLRYDQRKALARDWNGLVDRGTPGCSIGSFARSHGLSRETWRRELHRGACGAVVRHVDRRGFRPCGRYDLPRYDPDRAQQSVTDGNLNKGVPMTVTNAMAARFEALVLGERRSPYDAMMTLREENPGRRIPCLRTWYNFIYSGLSKVTYGSTPYHPCGRKRHPFPHPAHVVPGHRPMEDRPREASDRSELGHYEMDTVVSGAGRRGGLLVLIDRRSRRYVIERLRNISLECVLKGLRSMKARGALDNILSVTTDNGMEFWNAREIRATLKADVFYTRAYAAWEKGSIENCNRIVRRWYPKKTDFYAIQRGELQWLENTINSIHRRSLGGLSATSYERLTA